MSDFNSQSESAEPPPNEHSGSEAALDLPVDRRVIERLFRAGVIDDRGRQESLRLISGPVVWWPWIDKALLFLGLALALTGVVCFFAWNWADLPGLAKLGIVQAGIVACCGVVLRKGLESAIGKAAQIGAESYFFEEDSGGEFAQAKFAELKVGSSGECVLVGLLDEKLNRISGEE